MWSHFFRQQFHAAIDTDNLQSHSTMSFEPLSVNIRFLDNNSLTGQVTSWCSLSWPRIWIQHQNSNAYTTHYRQPRHQLSEFLLGRSRQGSSHLYGQHGESRGNQIWSSMATDDCYAIKSNSGGIHTVDILVVFAHAKVLLYNRCLANTCFQCFHNQIGAEIISPNLSPTVSIWHWKYHHLVWMWNTKRWTKRQYQIWASQRKVTIPTLLILYLFSSHLNIDCSKLRGMQKTAQHSAFLLCSHWMMMWRSCSGWWTPLQHDCFINPVQWWIASHYCKKLELQNTGKRWGCNTDCYEASTKIVNRNHKPPKRYRLCDEPLCQSLKNAVGRPK